MKKIPSLLLVISTIGLVSCDHAYFAIEQSQDLARDERDAARDKEIDERFDELDRKLSIKEENSSTPTVSRRDPTPSKPIVSRRDPTPSKPIVSRRDPTQFVEDYYSSINNGQIAKAWDMLTVSFGL